ncbi:MAG: hypothetical protein Fur0032_20780 [Terrimicrobiaceae bacterium]
MAIDKTTVGKRVAITGGRGRLAPLAAGFLRARGWNVQSYSREGTDGLLPMSDLLNGRTPSPDWILHCAWSSLPITAEKHPDGFELEDIPTLKGLLSTHPHARMVFFSTAAVYGNTGSAPAAESHPTAPLGAYARGKLAAEDLISSQASGRSLILRITNLLGHPSDPDRPQGVLPKLIACAQSGRPFEMWARPEGRKDYLDTRDFLEALALLMSGEATGIVNMASGNSFSLPELIKAVEAATETKLTIIPREPFPWDVVTSRIDNTRLRSLINWQPDHKLADSIWANMESAR